MPVGLGVSVARIELSGDVALAQEWDAQDIDLVVQALHGHGPGVDALWLLEPLGITRIDLERQRLDRGRAQALMREKACHGGEQNRVEMPVAPGAQIHPARHMRAPKLHRLANEGMVDAQRQAE
jgi:hypothetical protein